MRPQVQQIGTVNRIPALDIHYPLVFYLYLLSARTAVIPSAYVIEKTVWLMARQFFLIVFNLS